MGYLWLVGVVLVTAASSGSTVGIILMKKSFGDTGEHQTCGDKLIWISGLVMMILGAILDFVAFGFAAQSLIAPLGSVTLLCNVILSPIMLGETVAMSDWVASVVIAAGCTVAIAFGDHETKTYTYDYLMDLYSEVGVIVYLPTVALTVIGLFVGAYVIEKPAFEAAEKERSNRISLDTVQIGRNKLSESGEALVEDDGMRGMQNVQLPGGFMVQVEEVPHELEPLTPGGSKVSNKSPRDSDSSEGSDGPLNKKPQKDSQDFQEDTEKPLTPQQVLPHIPQKLRLFHGFCKAAAGGLAGSCSVLFGKGVAEIVKPCFTDNDGSGFTRYQTYLIIFAMTGTLVIQMKGLNGGLEFHPAVFVVPVYQTFWIMGSIIGGGVYFKEFEGMEALNFAMFVIGVILSIVGVYILTYFRWDAEMAKFEEELGLVPKNVADDDSDCHELAAIGVQPTKDTGKVDQSPEKYSNLSVDTRSDSDNSETDPNATNRSPMASNAARNIMMTPYEQDIADNTLKPDSAPEGEDTLKVVSARATSLPPIRGSPSARGSLESSPHPSQDKASRAAMRKKRMLRKQLLADGVAEDQLDV